MKRVTITLVCLLAFTNLNAQNNYKTGIIELGSAYKSSMFTSEATSKRIEQLIANNSTDSLETAMHFILECLKKDNDILQPEFLSLPNDLALKSIFMALEVSENMRKEGGPYNQDLVDSLMAANIKKEVLVNDYYGAAFTANGNKNKPFDLSKYDFDVNSMNLKNTTEKGIFFLRCMAACGSQIWGYMNIPRPANTDKAMDYIDNFPKINGQEYYIYSTLHFKDFDVIYDDSLQSFKTIYVHKYFDLMLNHLMCIKAEKKGKKGDKASMDFLMSSTLKDEELYKYTSHKANLERVFQKQ